MAMTAAAGGAIIMAIAIPCIAVVIMIVAQRGIEYYVKQTRDAYSPEPIRIAAAKVATDLVPLIDKLPLRGSEIWIFGTDGRYFVKGNRRVLTRAIKRWARQGADIRYILLQPGDGVRDAIQPLMKKLEGLEGSFTVSVLRNHTSGLEDILPGMKTRHPTLFFGSAGRNAMWLEGKHKENAVYAYNVRYVSPEAMKGEQQEEFEKQKKNLELIMQQCRDLVPSDSRMAA